MENLIHSETSKDMTASNKLNELAIEIIQQCPNCCIHCSSYSDLCKANVMPVEKVKEVINDAKVLGAKLICISGGEPFLHKGLKDIVEYIKAKGLQCYVYSSGIFHKDGEYCSIPVSLLEGVAKSITKLIVNYETTDSGTYDRIMGTSCNGLSLLEGTITSAISLDITVEAHFVPMAINYRHINSVVSRCEELGVKKVSFLRLVMQGRAKQNCSLTELSQNQMAQLMDELKALKKEKASGIRLGIPFSQNKLSCSSCHAGSTKISIRYDGLVYPCEAFKNDEPKGLVSAKPESIYDKRFADIYRDSEYLIQVRQLVAQFKSQRHYESCVNQYYRSPEVKDGAYEPAGPEDILTL